MTSSKRALALASALAAAIASAIACGGGQRVRERPTPTVATSAGASYEMAEIEAAWQNPTPEGRLATKDRLERFIQRFPQDGATPLARVYLALLDLDAGDRKGAETQLAALETLGPGATHDFATVARAEALRVGGRPADALDLLRPLAGKMVDRDARQRFDEAIVRAAIDAGRDYEALAYMDAWIRNTDEHERDAVRERVRAAVAKMPSSVLVPSLAAMRRRDGASGYGRDIQRIITARVAEIAVEEDDAKLARWLVDADAGSVLTDETELLVGELATRQAGGTAFIGRTVGVVLPTATSALRDAAGDVARGIAWAMEIPRTRPGAGDDTRLVTRDDSGRRGQLESQLEELAAEGAGLIVAGLDADSADRAVRWSEGSGIPVLTLAAPARSRPRSSAFVLGESTEIVVTALANALAARHETRVAVVADRESLPAVASVLGARTPKLELFQPAPCEIEDQTGGEPRFPLEAWEKAKFRTWLVVGPESCARDVLRDVGDLGGALIALSLDAAGKVEPGLQAHVLSAAAGIIPVLVEPGLARTRTLARRPASATRAAPADARRDRAARDRDGGAAPSDRRAASEEIARYVETMGGVPTWEIALGRDAGVLARRALRALPLDTAKSADEVARRRDEVRASLLAAKEKLWATDAMSFAPATHALPRTIRVIDFP
jgi:hypothetical protein